MNTKNISPSPEALLAGIEAVARAIGRNCQMDMYIAMARVDTLKAVAATDDQTLRDQFAAAALPAVIGAVLTGSASGADDAPVTEEIIAAQAYEFADAMLARRGVA